MSELTRTDRRLSRAGFGGFTLVELMVVVSIIVLMLITFIGVAGRVRGSSSIRKTKAVLALLETSIDQYHAEKGVYPSHLVDCLDISSLNYTPKDDQLDFYVRPADVDYKRYTQTTPTRLNAVKYNSAILRWQLTKLASTRASLEKIPAEFIVDFEDDQTDNDFQDLPASCGTPKDPKDVDYKYFIDAFGTPINYQQVGGVGNVPVLISAGPDEMFDTDDDITAGRN